MRSKCGQHTVSAQQTWSLSLKEDDMKDLSLPSVTGPVLQAVSTVVGRV